MKRLNKLFAQILVLTLLLCLLSGCGSAGAETGAVTTVPETDTAIQTTAAVPVQTTEEPVTSTESAAHRKAHRAQAHGAQAHRAQAHGACTYTAGKSD